MSNVPAPSARPGAAAPIRVSVVLLEKSHTPDPASIAPYSQALAVYRYRLLQPSGNLAAGAEILAAHWVIRDFRVIPGFSPEIGDTVTLSLEDMASHPELESERLIQDMDAWDLPLFIDMGPTTRPDRTKK